MCLGQHRRVDTKTRQLMLGHSSYLITEQVYNSGTIGLREQAASLVDQALWGRQARPRRAKRRPGGRRGTGTNDGPTAASG
jgi:hypothetical protein